MRGVLCVVKGRGLFQILAHADLYTSIKSGGMHSERKAVSRGISHPVFIITRIALARV